jgi:hypothetical protein
MRAILFVPGLTGTALVVGGFVSETYGMVVAGFGVAGVAAVVMLVLKARDGSAESADRKRIWTSGTAAAARIVAIAEAPGSGEDIPEVDLQLDIAGDQVKVRSLISRLAIPRIQPGCEIQVRRDPADLKKIVLDPALTPYRMD